MRSAHPRSPSTAPLLRAYSAAPRLCRCRSAPAPPTPRSAPAASRPPPTSRGSTPTPTALPPTAFRTPPNLAPASPPALSPHPRAPHLTICGRVQPRAGLETPPSPPSTLTTINPHRHQPSTCWRLVRDLRALPHARRHRLPLLCRRTPARSHPARIRRGTAPVPGPPPATHSRTPLPSLSHPKRVPCVRSNTTQRCVSGCNRLVAIKCIASCGCSRCAPGTCTLVA